MSKLLLIFLISAVFVSGCIGGGNQNQCTEEQKDAELCTLDYTPVCGDDGITYSNVCFACSSGVESWVDGECEEPEERVMTKEYAIEIAENSECLEGASLSDNVIYNENTKTWWIDLIMDEEMEGCSPACVVHEETKTVEINWRCTGLIT